MAQLKVINIFKTIKVTPKSVPPIPQQVWEDPLYFTAFGFGSGAIPVAPGTFGTLMSIPFYLVFRHLPIAGYLIFVILFSAFSMWISEKVSRDIHVHDHPGMCIDEFAGFFVTMILAPSGFFWILAGFLLFRLFDILKPWPICVLDEKVPGGFGMVLDDIVAGIFAFILMQLLRLALGIPA